MTPAERYALYPTDHHAAALVAYLVGALVAYCGVEKSDAILLEAVARADKVVKPSEV